MLVLQNDASLKVRCLITARCQSYSKMPVLQQDASLTKDTSLTICHSFNKMPVLQQYASRTARCQSYNKMLVL